MEPIALLIQKDVWSSAIKVKLPMMDPFFEVEQRIFNYNRIVLWDKFRIRSRTYQILDLWRRFMVVHPKYRYNKIGIISTRRYQEVTGLRVDFVFKHKENTDWIDNIPALFDQPDYPNIKCEDIINRLELSLMSHRTNNFRGALSDLRVCFLKLEGDIWLGEVPSQDHFLQIELAFQKVQGIWMNDLLFYQWMPHFPEMRGWLRLEGYIIEALGRKESYNWISPKFSRMISQYLTKPINHITRLYNMEPYGKFD
ncbi:MAG: hypothetical protein AAFY71_19600 [Bacteroidota bacterium]